MDKSELHELADGWIAHAHKSRGNPESEEYWWAWIKVSDLLDDDPESVWQIILIALEKEKSSILFENLSAGPLESLLAEHGDRFIDRVEQEAARNPEFAYLLGGVWQNMMSDNVWRRVQKVWDRRGWDGIPR